MSLFANLGQDPEESQILQALECRQTLWSPQRCPKDAAAHNRRGGEISAVSLICFILGLPAVHTSATAPVWFLFSTFFFWLGCLLFGIFWKLSLKYLHFAHTAGNSSGTVLGNVGFARGPCRFSDVVLPAPHLRVSGEPYPWELYEWKNKEEVMVDRDTSSGHMHVCPAVVALLAGWKSNGLGGALISFFSQVIHLFM